MLCFQSLAVLPSLKRFFNARRQLHSAEHTSINSAQEGLRLLLWWEDALLSGCTSQGRAIKPIPLAYCHEHMWCWSSSLGDFSSSMCGHFWNHGVSLLAPCFASLLSIRCGFPTVAYFFSCSYHWFPMYDDSTKRNSHAILKASTSLECFHFFLEHLHLHQDCWEQSSLLPLCSETRTREILWDHGTKKELK